MKLLGTISIDSYLTATGSGILWMIVIFLVNVQQADAQQVISTSTDRAIAYNHLSQLQKGTLVMVLKSDNKKRTELQKVIDSKKSSASQRRRAEKQLKNSIRDRNKFHFDLIDGFAQAYTFSDYRWIYDSDLVEFMDGEKGLLLDNKLNRDENIEIKTDGAVYYAREGYTQSSESARVLSYIVYDSESKQLKFPFPSVKISNIGPAMIFRSLFDKTEYRDGISIVERFDYLLKHRMASLRD